MAGIALDRPAGEAGGVWANGVLASWTRLKPRGLGRDDSHKVEVLAPERQR